MSEVDIKTITESSTPESSKLDYGFMKIDKSEKKEYVKNVFSSVASSYDIMNDLMSFGIHRMWKDLMIKELSPRPNAKILDLASGSADIAIRIFRNFKANNITPHITATDINPDMLEVGKEKVVDSGILENIDFAVVNAEEIPFPDNSFDYVTISFGIRNVTNIDIALKEIHRVLKPGGKFVCLEFSHPENDFINKIYSTYSENIIPKIGGKVANDEESYKYLVSSIKLFPDANKFEAMLKTAGFENTSYNHLTFGVVAIHKGFKI